MASTPTTAPPGTAAPPAAHTVVPEPAPRVAWLPLALLTLGQLLIVLDDTVVNLSVPRASAALGLRAQDRQWILTGYAAAFAALLPLGGQLADRFGARRMVLLGAAWFALASAVGAAAQSPGWLVGARVAQGAGAGLLGPAVLGALSAAYPSGRPRARAFGVFAAASAGGAFVGLILGGLLAEWSWRWSLLVSAVIAVPVLAGARRVTSLDRPSARLDAAGSLLALAGLLLLVAGLSQGSWRPRPLAAATAGAVLLAAFLLRQRRHPDPAVPLSLLRGTRGACLLALLLGYAGMFAVFLFLTAILQESLHLSPLRTGLAYLPMTVAIGLASVTSVSLLPRLGAGRIVPAGMVVSGAALAWLALTPADARYWSGFLAPTVLLGLGLGTVFAAATSQATAGADATGVTAALVNIAQQLGVALGTALLSGVATAGTPGAGVGALGGAHRAFATGGAIFLAGALVAALLLHRAARAGEALR